MVQTVQKSRNVVLFDKILEKLQFMGKRIQKRNKGAKYRVNMGDIRAAEDGVKNYGLFRKKVGQNRNKKLHF